MTTDRRLIILTEGHSDPISAKTATSVIRYRAADVVAVLDSTEVGKTAEQLLGVGGDIPVVGALADAPEANTLMIGIAPGGGKLPAAMRSFVKEAITRGMTVVSGLHEFLTDDEEFSQLASRRGATLCDVRKNQDRSVGEGVAFRDGCLRVQTVGHDCCVGKMVVAIEIARALQQRGESARFVATGQTGIMIEGDGCPVDCVVSDFINGAVEKLVQRHDEVDYMLIEGQGSLAHPGYSAVTLGLLHGARPQGMILCYEAGRQHVKELSHVPLLPLARLRNIYEDVAAIQHPSRVIGIGMNSRLLSPEQAEQEREAVRDELGLPVCDVFRHGPGELVEAVRGLAAELATPANGVSTASV